MALLTKTYLVKGLNRNLLLQKLIKAGVSVKKLKIIDEKSAEITIDSKDCSKYIAICKKTWYNNLVKVGGFLAPFYLMVKNPVKTVAFLLSLCLIVAGDFIYLKTEYLGDSPYFKKSVQNAFFDAGITKYSFITEDKLDKVRQALLSQNGAGYVLVEKRGNKVVVDMRILKQEPLKPKPLTTDLIASEDMKILNATVYSGTLLKFPGESVLKGEVIAGAYNIVDDKQIPCELHAVISAECTYTYVYSAKYQITEELLSRVYLTAKFALGDYEILSHRQTVKNKNLIEVEIKYEKIICGG